MEWIGDRKAKLQFSRPEILCSFLFALVHISETYDDLTSLFQNSHTKNTSLFFLQSFPLYPLYLGISLSSLSLSLVHRLP